MNIKGQIIREIEELPDSDLDKILQILRNTKSNKKKRLMATLVAKEVVRPPKPIPIGRKRKTPIVLRGKPLSEIIIQDRK